ncbi:MAG TPA: tetratricopeptide repeat protein [Myxococcaceae bacterium]|nr:tetratricopeptide repeat protein [Myxococcaceae bacterium]
MRTRVIPLLMLGLLVGPVIDARAQSPGRAAAREHFTAVEKALDAWDVPGARAAWEELARIAPRDSEPVRQLEGRILFEEGDYQGAIQAVSSVTDDDRPGTYLRLFRDTAKVVGAHRSVESEHFIFSYPEGKDAILAPYALEALEAIRKAMLEDLGHAPEGKVRVEVVHDARDLAKVSTLTYEQIKTTGTIAICKFNKLIITSPKAVVRGYDWLDTLAHEYIHLVVSQKSRNTVPIWLHEGMAKYLETRWRGEAGGAMSPSTLALLGRRVKADTLIPFEKMHPSIALLPTAEDAATAFAEVFFAIDWIHGRKGPAGLRTVMEKLREGATDRQAVAAATGRSFPSFERAWLQHVRSQPFPELFDEPEQEVRLKAEAKDEEPEKKGRQISYGAFRDLRDKEAQKHAHLGELLRERRRMGAAAEQYGKAYRRVGDRHAALSNKYALTLLELSRLDEAREVLEKSLTLHPGMPQTHVHLGRIHLHRGDWNAARDAFLQALAVNPFDPEVHLSLVRAYDGLGDAKRTARATAAVVQLTGLEPERVVAAAAQLGKQDRALADFELPEAERRDAAGAPSGDAQGTAAGEQPSSAPTP